MIKTKHADNMIQVILHPEELDTIVLALDCLLTTQLEKSTVCEPRVYLLYMQLSDAQTMYNVRQNNQKEEQYGNTTE